jgi:beta-lactamase class A
MKKSRKSERDPNKSFSVPNNLKFYGTIALSALAAAALFSFGFWFMSLFDRSKDNPVVNSPTISQQDNVTSPTNPSSTPLVSPSSISTNPTPSISPISPVNTNSGTFIYKVLNQTNFKPSNKLDKVVNSIVEYSTDNRLPTNALSITLIDTNTGEIAEYQGTKERYPASVVKMFWLVAIYQRISMGDANESFLKDAIEQMIYKSDNQGASQVLDTVTRTKSTSEKLAEGELKIQKQQRQSLNDFFRQAGYSQDINVSQKTFPIPQENIMEPKGFDQQLRGDNLDKPIRNKLTTNDAARLMYEIVNAQAVSPEISKKMRRLLTRDINPNFWKKQPPNPVDFNPVESFFGQGLPENKTENIVSKAGWTSASRQEVAFVKSKDGKTRYILAVFGDDPAYGKSKKIFPEISNLVYKQMRLSK